MKWVFDGIMLLLLYMNDCWKQFLDSFFVRVAFMTDGCILTHFNIYKRGVIYFCVNKKNFLTRSSTTNVVNYLTLCVFIFISKCFCLIKIVFFFQLNLWRRVQKVLNQSVGGSSIHSCTAIYFVTSKPTYYFAKCLPFNFGSDCF